MQNECRDGLFAFKQKCEDGKYRLGVYDLRGGRVLFAPRFYSVSFLEDGWMLVDYDDALGRSIETLFDRSGKEKFHSEYTSIYTWKAPNEYEVVIREEGRERHGLIEKDGTVILPCEYDVPWDGICLERKRIAYKENGKQGLMDFAGNVMIPPVYRGISDIDKPFVTVHAGEKDNAKAGLADCTGKEIVPAVYEGITWSRDGAYIFCHKDGGYEVLKLCRK